MKEVREPLLSPLEPSDDLLQGGEYLVGNLKVRIGPHLIGKTRCNGRVVSRRNLYDNWLQGLLQMRWSTRRIFRLLSPALYLSWRSFNCLSEKVGFQ